MKGSTAVLDKAKLFSGGGRRWLLAVVVVVALVPAAKAGIADILSIFQTINSTLRQAGGFLNEIQNLKTTVVHLEQQVLWPVSLINQARSFVATNEAQTRPVLSAIQNLATSSATLVSPSQLESIVRSAEASNVGQLRGAFLQVYSSVPLATQAPALERNVIDMDDATGQESLKTALISDQASQQLLNIATGIEHQTASSAPGSAPMLAAQARVAELENQAYLAKMLAAQLRQEAIQLAHENALRKKSVDSNRTLRLNLQQMLTPPSGGNQ